MTTQEIETKLAAEIAKNPNVWTDRRKTLEEMLSMRKNAERAKVAAINSTNPATWTIPSTIASN
jgi:hypothetical protein